MKKIACLAALALFATAACHGPADAPAPAAKTERSAGAGIFTGPQSASITLTSATVNDLSFGKTAQTAFLRIVPNSGGSTLTGLLIAGSGVPSQFDDGDLIFIRNDTAGTDNLTLAHKTGSTTADQFNIAGGGNVVLLPHQVALVEYDATLGLVVMEPSFGTVKNGNQTIGLGGELVTNGGPVPVLSSCGTGSPVAAAGSTNLAGTYTTGGTATTCTITFAGTGFANTPSCIYSAQGTATQPTCTASTTAITCTVDIAATTYSYACFGH